MFAPLQRVFRSVPLESSSKKLLALFSAVALASGLSNLFVGVFFWRLLSSYQLIAWYNLVFYAGILVFSPVAALYASRKGTRSLIRLGIILLGVFFLAILLLGNNTGYFILPLGLLNGAANAFYWTGMNVQTSRVVASDQKWYLSLVQAVVAAVAIAGPPISGFVISLWPDYTGYSVIFALSTLTFVIAFGLVVSLPDARDTFDLKPVFRLMKKDRVWKSLSVTIFLCGFRQGVFDSMIGILTFLVLKNEFSLGNFNMFVSIIAILFAAVAGRFIKNKRRSWFFLAGTLSLTLGITVFVVFQDPWALIVYGVMEALGRGPWTVSFDSYVWAAIAKRAEDCIGEAPGRLEYIIHREFGLELGRIASLAIFLLLAVFFDPAFTLKIMMPALCAAFVVSFFFFRKADRLSRV